MTFVLRWEVGAADIPFVALTAEGEPVPARDKPARLPPNPALPTEIALEAARSFDVAVTGGGAAPFAVDGVTFVDWTAKPLARVARGAPTVFAFANRTAVVQAMRLGGHVARLLHSMDDGWEPYWRDTILIQPGRTLQWPSSPTIPANGRSNPRFPSTALPGWGRGLRSGEGPRGPTGRPPTGVSARAGGALPFPIRFSVFSKTCGAILNRTPLPSRKRF